MNGKPLDPLPWALADYDYSVSRIAKKETGFDFSPRNGYSQNEEDYYSLKEAECGVVHPRIAGVICTQPRGHEYEKHVSFDHPSAGQW